jgi:3-hydroxybutyryl-CoA dehydratase
LLIETEAIGDSGLNVELGSIEATEGAVARYLRAVGNDLPVYGQTGLVPPLYLAAASLALLLRELAMPPGAVHSLQETEVLAPVVIGEKLQASASLERPRQRAGLKFLTATCGLHTSGGWPAMTSKTTVMLTETAPAGKVRGRPQPSPGTGVESGASELPVVTSLITQEQLTDYSQASGDYNPLHLDADFAATTQFGGVIAHGMLTLALVDRMMTASLGRAWLEAGSLRVRFKGAAYLGDRVESWGSAAKGGNYAVGVRNSNTGQELVSGTAKLTTA